MTVQPQGRSLDTYKTCTRSQLSLLLVPEPVQEHSGTTGDVYRSVWTTRHHRALVRAGGAGTWEALGRDTLMGHPAPSPPCVPRPRGHARLSEQSLGQSGCPPAPWLASTYSASTPAEIKTEPLQKRCLDSAPGGQDPGLSPQVPVTAHAPALPGSCPRAPPPGPTVGRGQRGKRGGC